MKKLTFIKLQLIFRPLLVFVLFSICCPSLDAQNKPQTQADSYTLYELLSPESQSFRIVYDVSATTAGNIHYFNTLRKGSEHKIDEVIDLMTGTPLKWEIINGAFAKSKGHSSATEDMEYLMVHLARPVPENGEARIRIDKTYKDINSYFQEGDEIVFKRNLGIKRNALVLPSGYELISCNYPSQVEMESDGRIKLSFINLGNSAVDYIVKAKKLKASSLNHQAANEAHPWADYKSSPQGRDKSKARLNYQINERAYQDREIVYFPLQPETHSFRLYHDYTESREGVDKYLNVVRAGSKASNPSAYILDTGEKLKVETLVGQGITDKGIDLGSPVMDDTEVIVIWFAPVKKGHSTRLRIEETYTDPNRYLLYNNELVWDRSFGRNRNTVVLPEGWWLTTNAIPAIIDQTPEGQPRLYFVNDRPDNIDVLIRARRR
jgi:hypothetical protein